MSKFKTWCKIIDYVEEKDPELAELLRGTCADMTLSSMRGKSGTTFLMPSDTPEGVAYKKKIAEFAYSSDPKEAGKACDMLNALILRDVFKTPSDFRRPVVPNSLFPSQQLSVKSVSARDVTFDIDGVIATAVPDSDFKDSSKRTNLAVWKLTGEIPVTTDKPANLERVITRKKGKSASSKSGGYLPTGNLSHKLRWQIAITIEQLYSMLMIKKSSGASVEGCPYLRAVLSLMLWLEKNNPLVLQNVLPLIAFDKLDLYLIIEPHRLDDDYLISDEDIQSWWSQHHQYEVNDCNSAINRVNKMLVDHSGTNYAVFSQRDALLREITNIRQDVIMRTNSKPRESVNEIEKIYTEISTTNKIGSVSNVFPPGLATLYRNRTGLYMLHCDIRYITSTAFDVLESETNVAGSFDTGKFSELVNMIGEALHANTNEEINRAYVLLDKNKDKYRIDVSSRYGEILRFVNSTEFLFIPLTREEANCLAKSTTDIRKATDMGKQILRNYAGNRYQRHLRIQSRDVFENQIDIERLNVILDKLDIRLRAEIVDALGPWRFGVAVGKDQNKPAESLGNKVQTTATKAADRNLQFLPKVPAGLVRPEISSQQSTPVPSTQSTPRGSIKNWGGMVL